MNLGFLMIFRSFSCLAAAAVLLAAYFIRGIAMTGMKA